MTSLDPDPQLLLPEQLETWQQTLDWQPTPQQQQVYQRLYEAILQGNQQLNLTRITESQDFWEKHLWDSLRGIKPWLTLDQPFQRVIDIGTGPGFPGLPVAVAYPDWRIVLLDSTRKKIAFLDALLAALDLTQAQTVVGRAEQVGHLSMHREKYDLALIRAVAAPAVCAEYALPLLKLGGTAVLYRGQWQREETTSLASAAQQLGGEIDRIECFETPLSHSIRHCIYLRKTASTPLNFPRPIGVPTQKPLSNLDLNLD